MIRCICCGLPEEDHHIFMPPRIPQGCQCDPRDWGDPANIPPPCNQFEPWAGDASACVRCEHDEACHAADR